MISIFYTGDRRHNAEIMRENHEPVIQELATLDSVEVSWFTKDYADRGHCPFDEGGDDRIMKRGKQGDHWITNYRRGQGGAVQVWDFLTSAERVTGDIVIKFRTDVWFTDSARNVLIQHVRDIIKDNVDVIYFGSDLVNDNQGKEHEVYEVTAHDPARLQDFVIAARRTSLNTAQRATDRMLAMPPRKIRSGNKTFRYILGDFARARGVLCHLWLIRKSYDSQPTDRDVCRDYIDSYMSRTRLEENHLLDAAWDWWTTYQC
jgi:hypothetical protein